MLTYLPIYISGSFISFEWGFQSTSYWSQFRWNKWFWEANFARIMHWRHRREVAISSIMAKIEMGKNIHLQIWKKFAIWRGNVLAIWKSLGMFIFFCIHRLEINIASGYQMPPKKFHVKWQKKSTFTNGYLFPSRILLWQMKWLREVTSVFSPSDASKVRAVKARFAKPVFPGQTIR